MTTLKCCFDDLPDCVLEEILVRLPVISAHRSKLVCKRWHSMMSQPYFAVRFSQDKKLSSSGFVYHSHKQDMYKLYSDSGFECFAPFSLNAGLSLNFKNFESPDIVASSDDLILLRYESIAMEDEYLVYNIVTKNWVCLPGFPVLTFREYQFCIGFTTKGDGEFAMIVVMEDMRVQQNEFPDIIVAVLSSKALEWVVTKLPYPPRIKNHILSSSDDESDEELPLHLRFSSSNAVSYKGSSLWIDNDSMMIIGIDPFNIRENPWVFVDPPKDLIPSNIAEHLGICEGNLRICQISTEDRRGDLVMKVWDLKDTEWVLHHQSSLCALLLNEPNLNRRNLEIDHTSWPLQAMACNPNDPNIIYLYSLAHLLAFNISTLQIKSEHHYPPIDEWTLYDVIPLKLQWQPTPLPG